MEMKVGLTLPCMNLKKSAKMKQRTEVLGTDIREKYKEILKKSQRKMALGFIA